MNYILWIPVISLFILLCFVLHYYGSENDKLKKRIYDIEHESKAYTVALTEVNHDIEDVRGYCSILSSTGRENEENIEHLKSRLRSLEKRTNKRESKTRSKKRRREKNR